MNESRELLDEVEPQIIELEQMVSTAGSIDEGLLNGVFRLFHTLKGSASFLDLQTIIDVTHAAETLLDYFRSRQVMVTSQHVDLLCRTADFIRRVLNQVEQRAHDRGFEEDARYLVEDLAQAIAFITSEYELSRWDEQKPLENTKDLDVDEQEGQEDTEITADLIKRFVEEALDLCEDAESAILALEQSPETTPARKTLQAFHNLKGMLPSLDYLALKR